MANFLRDTRFGFRLLRKNPGFAAVAILALALGIGANTAIFSIFYATLLAPFPYPQPDQLVVVWSSIGGHRNSVSAGDYLDWKRDSKVFQILGAVTGEQFNVSAGVESAVQVEGSYLTPGFLDQLIGDKPFMGRYLLPDDTVPGKDHVVIITHKLWETHFGADPNIIGKQIHLNGQLYTVIGVQPPGQPDRLGRQLVLPLVITPDQNNHDFRRLVILGRMKPGVTLAQANADMDTVARHIAEDYPKSNKGWGATVVPLKNDFLNPETKKGLPLLLGMVGFVLLIACANVANLLLARGAARQREVAVRASVGASRRQIFSQFLIESLALASIGGVLGIALAWVLMKAIVASMPPYTLLSETDVRMSVPVLLFTVVSVMLAGVLFGCAPAWRAARMNLNEVLKEGGGSARSTGRHGLRRALVIAEFALALSLLAGGGLAIHSLWNLAHVDLGFRSDHLLTFDLPVAQGRLADPVQITTFYRQVLEKIQALPGVTSASASEGAPLQGVRFGMPFQIAGKEVTDMSQRPLAGFNMVTPDYFKVFGIGMAQGRAFNDRDQAGGVQVAVVNEKFAKQFFAGVDPLSQRILVQQLIPGVTRFGDPISWQIVGVYKEVRNGRLEEDFPEIDVPFWQSPWPQARIAVRAAVEPDNLTRSIAGIVQSIDPDLPLGTPRSMDQVLAESMSPQRFTAFLFGGFATVALLLAAVGIYGVMSFAVAQRTHEIGLRMALGAGQGNVLALILKEGMTLAGVGLALGLFGAYAVGKVMHGVLFNVAVFDFAAFGAVSAALLLAGLLACFIPAHRATLVDPMQALRQE
ncbi:MAG: ABC transporter permease [Candidatus Acidiferrales bacterium]|jgi:putative ABC transport system permease protein